MFELPHTHAHFVQPRSFDQWYDLLVLSCLEHLRRPLSTNSVLSFSVFVFVCLKIVGAHCTEGKHLLCQNITGNQLNVKFILRAYVQVFCPTVHRITQPFSIRFWHTRIPNTAIYLRAVKNFYAISIYKHYTRRVWNMFKPAFFAYVMNSTISLCTVKCTWEFIQSRIYQKNFTHLFKLYF